MFGFNHDKSKAYDGNLVLPKEFDTIEESIGEGMLIKRGERYGVINQCGKVIIEPAYESVHYVEDDIFVVEIKCGFQIFIIGRGILPEIYESKEAAIAIIKAKENLQ